jgi:TolA-binding protein
MVLGVIVLTTAGCAYYNTFYFAKKYFAQAEKLAQASGSDKVSPEAARKYDDVIKQSTKVLKFHGGSRWVDDALYLIGASFFGKREYEDSLRKFDELVANYPESRWVPWALYKSGLAHFERKDDDQADTYFQRVLTEYPRFQRTDDILYTRARAAERQRDRVEAVRRYRVLVDRFPRSDRGQEGLLRIGDLYFDAGFADSAYASYAEASRLARDDVGIRNAEVRSADALVRLQRAPEAVRMLERLLPSDETQVRSGDAWPAQVRVHLALAYNATGRYADALASLRTVVAKYPQSSFAPEAQFQVGYTYEVYLDSLDAARSAYDKVGRTGQASAFRDQAQTRARNLAQLQSLRSQALSDSAAGSDKQAEAQLKIAELFLLSQNKVPEAVQKYREVQRDFPRSRFAPKAAYALAWIRLKRMDGQRDSAVVAFAQLIRDYPTSPAARGALDLLISEGADTTGLTQLVVETVPDTVAAETAPPPAAPVSPAKEIGPGGQVSEPDGMAPDSLRGARRSTARPRGRPGAPRGVPGADTLRAPRGIPVVDTLPPSSRPGIPPPDTLRAPRGASSSDTSRVASPRGLPADTLQGPPGAPSTETPGARPDTLRPGPKER